MRTLTWHIDRNQDVRSLMSVCQLPVVRDEPSRTGPRLYYLRIQSRVPIAREGANRISRGCWGPDRMTARQELYLRHCCCRQPDDRPDAVAANEALIDAVIFCLGRQVMTHFDTICTTQAAGGTIQSPLGNW
jgi:hypothetical protein